MEDNKQIGSLVKSAAGNLFFAFVAIVGVAFLAGIPVGKAAHDFTTTMFSPNVDVSNNQ